MRKDQSNRCKSKNVRELSTDVRQFVDETYSANANITTKKTSMKYRMSRIICSSARMNSAVSLLANFRKPEKSDRGHGCEYERQEH